MKFSYPHLPTMFFMVLLLLTFASCNKDSDLFYESILEQEEVEEPDTTDDGISEDPTTEDPTTEDPVDDTPNRPTSSGGNPDWFPWTPETTKPDAGPTYTPSSAADISNPANAGKTAVISSSFDCTGCTFAANQLIVPSGGAIDGNNINLNGSYIDQKFEQAFASSANFTEVYDGSWVAPEVFGGYADDTNDDYLAIQALMENVQFVKSKPNGVYIKNNAQYVDRTGSFIWDMNGGSVEVTSNNAYYGQSVPPFMFFFVNMSVKFINGTIDMNNLYGRGIWITGQQAYHFENITIQNLYSTVKYRAEALRMYIYQNTPSNASYGLIPTVTLRNDFVNGYMNNCTFQDIKAESDCQFNNVPAGVAKGVWILYEDINSTDEATIYHSNNTFQRIYGDDAEALYLNDETFGGVGSKVDVNNISTTLYNETYREISRRAIKATVSNVTIESCKFEMVKAATANGALASLVDFFTLTGSAGNNIEDWDYNIVIDNNEFIQEEELPSTDSKCGGYIPSVALLSLTSISNAQITNNTFIRPSVDEYGAIRLGASGAPAGGKFEDVTFSGNTFVNSGYRFITYVETYGASPITIINETFTYDISGTGGAGSAAFRFWNTSSSEVIDGVSFKNIDIRIDSSPSGFNGLLYSNGASLENCDFSNILITYNGSSSSPMFGRMKGNMNSSNTIDNCDIVGASASGALVIDGAGSPVITNSTGDGSSKLTVD